MSRGTVTVALSAVALLWAFTIASAQQPGTAVEAQAMFDRAVAAIKADKVKALSEFNDKNNKQFHDRDLYVFCYSMSDGKFTAHPSPAVMGVDVRTLKFRMTRSDKEATTGLKVRPKEPLLHWTTNSRSRG